MTVPLQGDLIADALAAFLANLQAAIPRLLSGLVFLVLAAVVVKVVLFAVKRFLDRALPHREAVYRQFVLTIVAVFLWFGVGLAFLSVVGLPNIAASLGTATGFVALGVAYASSNVIADAVAGVYLLRDPDFMPGDRVDVGGTVGTVRSIELRKTRFDVDGDVLVRGNAEIEKKWTKLQPEEPGNGAEATEDGADAGDDADAEA